MVFAAVFELQSSFLLVSFGMQCVVERQVSPPSEQRGSRAVYRYVIDARWGRFGHGLLDKGRAGVKAGNRSVAQTGVSFGSR